MFSETKNLQKKLKVSMKCALQSRFSIFVCLVCLFELSSVAQAGYGLSNDLKSMHKANFLSTKSDLKRVERNAHLHHISRRIAPHMVPIRERETTSLCSYEVVTDQNLQRIPDKIDKVICRKDSCKCAEQGGFKCTQLYTQLNVTYLTSDLKMSNEFDLIDVEYACVCSRTPGGANVNLLEPVLV